MKNIDLDLLSELIKKCEAKMASPFKKKESYAESEDMEEGEEDSDEEPAAAALVIEKKEKPMAMDEEMDMDALIELYKKMKA